MGEVARSFQMREALQGSRARLLPIIDCELGDVCFCEMTRKGLRLGFRHFWKLFFQHRCYARMQLLALASQ